MALRMSVDTLLTTTDSDFLVFTQSGPEVTVHGSTSDRLCPIWEQQVSALTRTNGLILYKKNSKDGSRPKREVQRLRLNVWNLAKNGHSSETSAPPATRELPWCSLGRDYLSAKIRVRLSSRHRNLQ